MVSVDRFDIIPGRNLGRDRSGNAGGSGLCDGGDEGGRGAENAVEMIVDVGFDIDGVRRRCRVDERDEDGEGDAEHGASGFLEVGSRVAGFLKGFLTLLGEGDDFGQEDDVLAIELHAGGIDLETLMVAVETSVEGVHGVHFAFSGRGI